jgi:Phosphoglycerate dehydrogenase and related dehydrogenases
LSKAKNLRWLQAPQAAPAAGYYYPELISHPCGVTNFREIYNDHIGAHILAFVWLLPAGCMCSFRNNCAASGRRARGDWRCRAFARSDGPGRWLGGIGAEAARLLAAFGVTVLATMPPHGGAQRGGRAASAGCPGRLLPRRIS